MTIDDQLNEMYGDDPDPRLGDGHDHNDHVLDVVPGEDDWVKIDDESSVADLEAEGFSYSPDTGLPTSDVFDYSVSIRTPAGTVVPLVKY